MIGYLNLFLRLSIWFLLTADFSILNISLGIAIAFLLPGLNKTPSRLQDWLRVFWEIVVAVPQAYWEAIEIMVSPHNQEEITLERVKPQRTPGLIFLDIFLITFTPKTVVVKYHEEGWYEVHKINRS
ncbi:Na+/H+ antiporter subunit E [Phormidium yuhuli AB48]|uniref:Na+/H+ antiporter subunit E n=1 Tax=Phormidium yuhuli AB48 TaxID=2940671 RepID=A0ABY5ARA0_9CYAN|nr:Na+/H+ antiporter subunit E [Phormidium yuhuli]USR90678.1 Na+/H+ antiporter subunit E [Phormidium yuhuli AB48]